MTSSRRNFVQGADLSQCLFRQRRFRQESSVSLYPAVLRDPMQIFICQKPLGQRAESDDSAAITDCRSLQAVFFYRAVKNGITVLINDKRAFQFIENRRRFLHGFSGIIRYYGIEGLAAF